MGFIGSSCTALPSVPRRAPRTDSEEAVRVDHDGLQAEGGEVVLHLQVAAQVEIKSKA